MYFNTMVEGVIGHVVLQIKRLVSNVKYPATITLSRTEINTKHIYDCMHSISDDDHACHLPVTNRLDSSDSLDQPSCPFRLHAVAVVRLSGALTADDARVVRDQPCARMYMYGLTIHVLLHACVRHLCMCAAGRAKANHAISYL